MALPDLDGAGDVDAMAVSNKWQIRLDQFELAATTSAGRFLRWARDGYDTQSADAAGGLDTLEANAETMWLAALSLKQTTGQWPTASIAANIRVILDRCYSMKGKTPHCVLSNCNWCADVGSRNTKTLVLKQTDIRGKLISFKGLVINLHRLHYICHTHCKNALQLRFRVLSTNLTVDRPIRQFFLRLFITKVVRAKSSRDLCGTVPMLICLLLCAFGGQSLYVSGQIVRFPRISASTWLGRELDHIHPENKRGAVISVFTTLGVVAGMQELGKVVSRSAHLHQFLRRNPQITAVVERCVTILRKDQTFASLTTAADRCNYFARVWNQTEPRKCWHDPDSNKSAFIRGIYFFLLHHNLISPKSTTNGRLVGAIFRLIRGGQCAISGCTSHLCNLEWNHLYEFNDFDAPFGMAKTKGVGQLLSAGKHYAAFVETTKSEQ